jgi:hypothetical protein
VRQKGGRFRRECVNPISYMRGLEFSSESATDLVLKRDWYLFGLTQVPRSSKSSKLKGLDFFGQSSMRDCLSFKARDCD